MNKNETLDLDQLNFWLLQQGPHAVEKLAYEMGIGFYTTRRIVKGQKQPTEPEKLALLKVTGMDRATLFKNLAERKESA